MMEPVCGIPLAVLVFELGLVDQLCVSSLGRMCWMLREIGAWTYGHPKLGWTSRVAECGCLQALFCSLVLVCGFQVLGFCSLLHWRCSLELLSGSVGNHTDCQHPVPSLNLIRASLRWSSRLGHHL